jgi:hypothetical protein
VGCPICLTNVVRWIIARSIGKIGRSNWQTGPSTNGAEHFFPSDPLETELLLRAAVPTRYSIPSDSSEHKFVTAMGWDAIGKKGHDKTVLDFTPYWKLNCTGLGIST